MSGISPVFVLLTDFGLADPYAGQIKAALFTSAPFVPILDLSHGVPPCNVATGAFFLASSRKYYPSGSIFICVVDPGVGSNRDLLCIQGKNHILLGPDNGLLALACQDMLHEGAVSAHTIAVPDIIPAKTFHGRDALVPAAVSLALGRDVSRIAKAGRPLPELPSWGIPGYGEGEIRCAVLHVDRYGNCILNVPNTDALPLYPRLSLHILKNCTNTVLHQAGYYAELDEGALGILPGGQGYYELAVNKGSAAATLGLAAGDACRILGNLWDRA